MLHCRLEQHCQIDDFPLLENALALLFKTPGTLPHLLGQKFGSATLRLSAMTFDTSVSERNIQYQVILSKHRQYCMTSRADSRCEFSAPNSGAALQRLLHQKRRTDSRANWRALPYCSNKQKKTRTADERDDSRTSLETRL